uniref:Uncharacterized protein n=1 Tax=Dunaliella tertiolecta TaxID=3047 RepID=A0A7S3R468_DUNTE
MKEAPPPSPHPILASPVGPSPVSKLDYVTRLISYHDQAITKQNVLISELVQRIGALEEHAKQSASQNATLVQQNVELCQELTTMKKSMDKAHKAQAKQEERERKQNERREAAQREEETRMLQVGLLQADIDKLKRQVESAEKNTESILENQVTGQKASIIAGLERQMQVVVTELHKDIDSLRSQMQSSVAGLRGELEQDVACIRAESSASASSVEASAMAANSVAMKLRNHMQACSTADAAAAAKIEGLEKTVAVLSSSMTSSAEGMADTFNRSVDGLSSAITRLGDDVKKVKKHVVKLERAVEGLQSLGHVAVAADKALQEVKRGSDQTAASVSTMMAQSKEAAQAVQSTLSRIAEVEAQMATATDMCASNRIDVGDMAESLGAAFQQVNEGTRKGLQQQAQQCQQLYQCLQQLQQQIQQQQQQPTSYLQSLLGPGPLSSTSAMSMARMQVSNSTASV